VQAFAALETNTNDFSSNPSNHLLGVAAQLPFGDPAYFARRAAASSGEEVARQSRAGLEESIHMDVLQAYENYQGTLASLPMAKETQERAARSLELFRPLYRSGRQSIIEVLRAEEGLARAEAAYWQTLFKIHTGYVQLLSSAGALDDKAIQEIARHLDPSKRNGERGVRP
jgi:outer membrane protein TolC